MAFKPQHSLDDIPLLAPGQTYTSINETITGKVLTTHTPLAWFLAFAAGATFVMILTIAVAWLLLRGVGIWGVNVPIAWGFAIINFVWWIGIGHAGTLISAILLLLHQQWRTSINRFAEAMTLFAVMCAGMFPLLHMGRPWVFYFLMPYPDTMRLWPQWRSPLVWDVFAVSTYFTVSLVFWYVGLIPDLAAMRDRARPLWLKRIYGIFSLGWRGAAAHWARYDMAYLLLAALATPLVVSVHSIVGLDFASSVVPGWHSTIFPPYFVAGAIFSGFAMVATLVIPIRAIYKLHDTITDRHLDYMARLMLAMGLIVAYGYLMEAFMAWYSGDPFERYVALNRALGPYAWSYWMLIACNVVSVQLFWFRAVRRNLLAIFLLSIVINIGMWLERFVIVITSLHRDYMPSAWDMYYPTIWDYATFLGTIGFFVACMFLFIRVLPMISMHEVSHYRHETAQPHAPEKVRV